MTGADLGGLLGGELDERVVAKAALEAAEEQLQSLCASHAGTFVSVERRGQLLEKSLKDLLESVKGIEAQLAYTKECLDQQDESELERNEGKESSEKGESSSGSAIRTGGNKNSLAALSEKHRVRRRTLLQHSSLLELLELPSLMDACVRSNLYEEALSIASFSNTLERRHTDDNVVVTGVINQIRSRQLDLRRHLLHRLKNQVTMPQCLEVVTALRQLNSIDLERQQSDINANLERIHAAMELRLQVDFLEARDVWLDLAANPNANASNNANTNAAITASAAKNASARTSEQLLDTIERYRTRVFEVATQFNAIFRAQQSINSALSSHSNSQSISLLSMWTSRRVHSFLNMLSIHLNIMEDSASLRDVLEACVFFSTSLGRLGADFTAQLPPIFESRMLSIIEHIWKDGAQQLSETLKICRNAGVVSPLVSHQSEEQQDHHQQQQSASSIEGAGGSTTTSTGGDENEDTKVLFSPPRTLMTVPALGRFVNSVLSGLNELRRCLLPGIFLRLRESLKELFGQVNSTLQMNDRAVNTPGFRGEAHELREVASKMKQLFKNIVQPYLFGSLELALGNDALAQQFHQQVISTLKVLAPKKEETKTEEESNDNETGDGDGADKNDDDNNADITAENKIDDADETAKLENEEEKEITPTETEG